MTATDRTDRMRAEAAEQRAAQATASRDDADAGPTSTEETPPDRTAQPPSSSGKSTSKKKRRRKSAKAKARKRTSSKKSLRTPIERAVGMVGIGVASFDPFAGAVVMSNANSVARSLDELAEANESVRRVLESVTGAGPGWAAVATSAMPIAAPLLWRAGLLPDSKMVRGMVPDEAIAMGIEAGQLDPEGHPIPADERTPPPAPDVSAVADTIAHAQGAATAATDRAQQ